MATTRHTGHALPGQPWGGFTGKTITEVVRIITTLVPHALPGRRYGIFEGKVSSEEPEPEEAAGIYRPTWRPRRR